MSSDSAHHKNSMLKALCKFAIDTLQEMCNSDSSSSSSSEPIIEPEPIEEPKNQEPIIEEPKQVPKQIIEEQQEEEEYMLLSGYENKYEIQTTYPFKIRNKRSRHILKESLNKTGAIQVCLNGQYYVKHLIIAKMFLPNPGKSNKVLHDNGDQTDNHLENLKWSK